MPFPSLGIFRRKPEASVDPDAWFKVYDHLDPAKVAVELLGFENHPADAVSPIPARPGSHPSLLSGGKEGAVRKGRASGATNKGAQNDLRVVYSENQDGVLVMENGVAVADGMGGCYLPQLASGLLLQSAKSTLGNSSLETVFQSAAAALHSDERPLPYRGKRRDPGSTLIVVREVIFRGNPYWEIGHCGDSMAYAIRRGENGRHFIAGSHMPHTSFSEGIRRGEVSLTDGLEEFLGSRRAGLLNVFVAGYPKVSFDTQLFHKLPGDKMLITSDAASDAVDSFEWIMLADHYGDDFEAKHVVHYVNSKQALKTRFTALVKSPRGWLEWRDVDPADQDRYGDFYFEAPEPGMIHVNTFSKEHRGRSWHPVKLKKSDNTTAALLKA